VGTDKLCICYVTDENILFDVDVVGGCNLKKYYGERALFIFVQAPSIEVLRSRLVGRGDTAPEEIEKRLAKAEHEMTYSQYADEVIINDNLDTAKAQLMTVIKEFLAK
jgi:guanylate kinase